MSFLRLFARLIVRPLRNELLRTLLTAFAVALGVAVVVAIELAGEAAAGSFRSSMETLSGKATLEIVATGGIDEQLLGKLVALPHPLRFFPRIEAHCTVVGSGATVPLIGLDLVAQDERPSGGVDGDWESLRDPRSIWVSRELGWKLGERRKLATGDRVAEYTVRGVIEQSGSFLVMDLAVAQPALGRRGRLDRIEVHLPRGSDAAKYEAMIRAVLPDGVQVRTFGTATSGNRRMLEGFRWNLRVLSFIALVVGAFLIYNTISISVVRRRAEIGVLRALGATRLQVTLLFLAEAAAFGLIGSLAGLAIGDVLAQGAVKMLGATVQSLYVSSTPAPILLNLAIGMEAALIGLGMSLAAALAPAREAAMVPPVEAMARGQRETLARLHVARDLGFAALAAAAAKWASTRPPVNGKPMFGYAAAFLLILAAALMMPAAVTLATRVLSPMARRILGVEGLLATRSLAASLARTSVLVGALSTAVAMMVSVGIMVGSFRETVVVWMESQLRADLYLRPAGEGLASRLLTIDPDVADRIARLPEVQAVDRFRLYEITYDGVPALLGAGQSEVIAPKAYLGFLPGQNRDEILRKLPHGDYAIVSEPFAEKHHAAVGSKLRLPLGDAVREFEVIGVYYDYSNERGYVILDRKTLLRYLPDPAPTNIAIYLREGVPAEQARPAVEHAVAGSSLVIFSNRALREEALRVFDRTFSITWALEAVAVLVAVLGIAGALLALVIDRRRELGLLRFLGGSASQIRRLLLCEAGLLGLLANVCGLALGWLLSLLLIYVINKQTFGWTIWFHWPVALLVSALSLVWIATIVAGLYPARMALALNPIEVIHEE